MLLAKPNLRRAGGFPVGSVVVLTCAQADVQCVAQLVSLIWHVLSHSFCVHVAHVIVFVSDLKRHAGVPRQTRSALTGTFNLGGVADCESARNGSSRPGLFLRVTPRDATFATASGDVFHFPLNQENIQCQQGE